MFLLLNVFSALEGTLLDFNNHFGWTTATSGAEGRNDNCISVSDTCRYRLTYICYLHRGLLSW